MEKKLLFFLSIFLLLALPIEAEETASATNGIIVTSSEGDQLTFTFEETPAVTFSEDGLVITTTTGRVTNLTLENYVEFTFADISATESIEASTGCSITLSNNVITFSGFQANATIALYNITGSLLRTMRTDATGYQTLRLDDFQHGTYIVTIANQTYKFRPR